MSLRQRRERSHLKIVANDKDYSLITEQPHTDALRELLRSANVPIRSELIDLGGTDYTCFRISEEHFGATEAVLSEYQRAE